MDAPIVSGPILLLADVTPPVQWAVLGLALVGIGIVLFKPKFLKRDPLSRTPQNTSLSQQRSVERQMQGLLVELSEMSRQVTSTLDTRAAKLDLLIREADEKIATLTALLSNPPSISASTFRNHAMPENFASEQSISERSAVLSAMPESTTSTARHGEPTMGSPADELPLLSIAASSLPSPYDADARHAEVYLLADQGQTSSEIAAQLRRPNGEIQLILALRPDNKSR